MKKSFSFLLFCLLTTTLLAQKIKYTDSFLEKLEQTQIDVFTPVEGKYKSVRPLKNDFQPIDHAIVSKREKIVIRYSVIPYDSDKPATQLPHVDFMRLVTSVASNDEDAGVVSVHALDNPQLKTYFNADWGSMAYFKPKYRFSEAQHCRLLALFKEGQGTVYVFFLFDEPSPALDNRLRALQFRTNL
ncbi:MAG: hypothetical protein AAF960_05115 [Bacteroidota bacterium]